MPERLAPPLDLVYPAAQLTTAELDGHHWEKFARCAYVDDPEIFFPEKGKNTVAAQALWECGNCPVRSRCLQKLMAEPTNYCQGVSAGLMEQDIRQVHPLVRKNQLAGWLAAAVLQSSNLERAFARHYGLSVPKKRPAGLPSSDVEAA